MLVNSKEVLIQAKKKRFAIPAPNFIDLDSARTFVDLAESKNLPLILPFAQAHATVLSLEEAALIGKFLAQKVTTPVVLHLDHGVDFGFVKQAIDLGFTSVMIDASTKPFEENIAITKEVVAYAHAKGATVEAELGHVGAGENYESHDSSDSVYTEVSDVIEFVKKTDIDSLAISIGTAHGTYKNAPKINFERLKEIDQISSIPLVLHGGSSSGDANLEHCALHGISKINIFTDLIISALDEVKEKQPESYMTLKELANSGMKKTLEHYFNVFHTTPLTVGE